MCLINGWWGLSRNRQEKKETKTRSYSSAYCIGLKRLSIDQLNKKKLWSQREFPHRRFWYLRRPDEHDLLHPVTTILSDKVNYQRKIKNDWNSFLKVARTGRCRNEKWKISLIWIEISGFEQKWVVSNIRAKKKIIWWLAIS